MDSYLSLPISERKVQQLVDDAKDFVYGLGKETENVILILYRKRSSYSHYAVFLWVLLYLVCHR